MTLSTTTRAGRSKEAKARKQLTAELTADQSFLGYTFEWEFDECPDLSWMSDEEREQDHEVLCSRIPDPQNRRFSLASLCGITDADSKYRRVIEAELAA